MKKYILYPFFILFIIIISSFIFFLLYNFKTNHTIVAVLDTGIDQNNPLFKNHLLHGYDFVHHDSTPKDTDGHGTAIAGVITSMNKNNNVKILPEKIIGKNNDTAVAVLYAIIHGANIVNMSYHEPYNLWAKWMIKIGTMKGVIFVAASGNQGKDILNYPAKYPDVISVLATNKVDTATLGNYGKGLNYVAPGINLKSLSLNRNYVTKSGTSLSAAYTSGVLAYLQNKYPHEGKKDLLDLLNNYSRSILYHLNNRTYLFKTIDFQKIKAAEEHKSYFWTSSPSPYYNNKFIFLPVDSNRINKIYVYDNHQLYKEYPGTIKRIILPTSEGQHKILILFGGGKKWMKKQLTYTIDTLAPVIKPSVTVHGNKETIRIHVKEKHLNTVTVNGQYAKPLLDFDSPTRDFIATVPKGDKIKIVATDMAQNRSVYILN